MQSPNRSRSWWFALPAVVAISAVVLMAGRGPVLAQWNDEEHEEVAEHEMHEHEMFLSQLELFHSMLDLMDRMAEMCKDRSRAGVLAVMSAEERFEDPRELANFLEQMGRQTDDPTIKRAVCVKLSEIYGDHDQLEQSREQLRKLILNDL